MSILQIYVALHEANFRSKFHNILQGCMAEYHNFCSRGQTIVLRSNLRQHFWKIMTRQTFFVFFTFDSVKYLVSRAHKAQRKTVNFGSKIFSDPSWSPQSKTITKNVFHPNLHNKRYKINQKIGEKAPVFFAAEPFYWPKMEAPGGI